MNVRIFRTAGLLLTVGVAALVLFFSFFAYVATPAVMASEVYGANDQVKLCHNNNGASDYSQVQAKAEAIVNGDNSGHPENEKIHELDIIPPFEYDFGEGIVGSYPGRNWNGDTEKMWGNKCKTPDITIDLSLTKTTDTEVEERFDFTGDLGAFSITSDTDDAADLSVTPGSSYMVREVTNEMWRIIDVSCEGASAEFTNTSFSVEVDGDATSVFCQIDNEYIEPKPRAQITLNKEVSGGDHSANFFQLYLSDEAVEQGVVTVVEPGTYEISEDEVTNYQQTNLECDGGTLEGNSLTVVANDEVTCTLTNTYRYVPDQATGTLKVFKWVTGEDVGPALPIDFSFSLDGGEMQQFGEYAFTKLVVTAEEEHVVTETNIPAGYVHVATVCSVLGEFPESAEQAKTLAHNSDWSTNTFTLPNEGDKAVCVIINEYEEDGGGGGGDDDTGVLEVQKVVLGTSTLPEEFSFRYGDGQSTSSAIAFDTSGINTIELPVGTYSVEELIEGDDYIVGYENCIAVEVTKDATSTCVVTNRYVAEEDTYRIEGFVWHDDNENTIWDGFEGEQDASTTEESLSGWMVEITNGDINLSTTTDGSGYYYFEVPAGTWTISEVVESGWAQTAPTTTTHTVTVPEAEVFSFVDTVLQFLVPVAHAAVVDTFGPFNFGNNEVDGSTDDGDGGGTTATDDDDDSSSSIRSRGNGGRSSRDEDAGGEPEVAGDSTSTPVPQVLGEQVSAVPYGAPNAGAGGAAPALPTVEIYSLIAPLMRSRRVGDDA